MSQPPQPAAALDRRSRNVAAEGLGTAVGLATAPEIAVPLLAVQHPRQTGGVALVAVSIVFILIAIIVLAAAKTPTGKAAGWVFLAASLAGAVYGGRLVRGKKRKTI
jgi:hypothetical protein